MARDGRDALGGGVAALAARPARRRTYPELTDAAAAWPAGAEGLWFQPYLAGERTPHADAHARGSFTGLSLRHDRGALARAVLEGVAFGLRDSLDLVGDLGVEASRARVSGGGARSQTWLQIVASVLDLPLERTAVDEGAAYGAALLGGVAGGVWSTRRRPPTPASACRPSWSPTPCSSTSTRTCCRTTASSTPCSTRAAVAISARVGGSVMPAPFAARVPRSP